jgi:hypothetical protein
MTEAQVNKRVLNANKDLQAIAALGGYQEFIEVGEPFWKWDESAVYTVPAFILMSKKKNVYLKPDMEGIKKSDGTNAKAFQINLGKLKFADVQTLAEYTENGTTKMYVTVARRHPNPAITGAALEEMETSFPGSTKNYFKALNDNDVSYILIGMDDSELE